MSRALKPAGPALLLIVLLACASQQDADPHARTRGRILDAALALSKDANEATRAGVAAACARAGRVADASRLFARLEKERYRYDVIRTLAEQGACGPALELAGDSARLVNAALYTCSDPVRLDVHVPRVRRLASAVTPREADWLWSRLARLHHARGRIEATRSALAMAMRAAGAVDGLDGVEQQLDVAALAYELGVPEQGRPVLDLAYGRLPSLEPKRARRALGLLAAVARHAGDDVETEVVTRLRAFVPKMPGPLEQIDLLTYAARRTSEFHHDRVTAGQLLQRAERLATGVAPGKTRIFGREVEMPRWAAAHLAEARAELGDVAAARAHMDAIEPRWRIFAEIRLRLVDVLGIVEATKYFGWKFSMFVVAPRDADGIARILAAEHLSIHDACADAHRVLGGIDTLKKLGEYGGKLAEIVTRCPDRQWTPLTTRWVATLPRLYGNYGVDLWVAIGRFEDAMKVLRPGDGPAKLAMIGAELERRRGVMTPALDALLERYLSGPRR